MTMDEDRLARLLEEIRDLLRQQVEAYTRVMANQEEALRLQREAMARVRKPLTALAVAIVIVLVIVLVLLRFVFRHYA